MTDPTAHRFDRRAVVLLTSGHFLIDLTQGAMGALMPFFVAHFGLNYSLAASLVLASSVASSIVQPLFGHYADRASASWLLPASLFAAMGGLIVAALSSSLVVAFAAVAVSGLGVAAFHPEAARLVHFAAGNRLTTAMSYFAVGGGVGFAAAPLLVAGFLSIAGASGLLILLVPVAIVAVMFRVEHQRHVGLVRRHETSAGSGTIPPGQWSAFALLGVTIAVRSTVFTGLISFLALYWNRHLGQTTAAGNIALSVLLGSSVVGTLVGGRLADRFGRRSMLRWGMLCATGALCLLAAADNANLAMFWLLPAGALFAAASSPLIVLGQQYLPGRVGMASGTTIGLAVSCGGAAAPLLGWAADTHGIQVVPWVLTGLALTAALLAFGLPHPNNVQAQNKTATTDSELSAVAVKVET